MVEMDRFLKANRDHTSSFNAGDLPAPPARGVAVVTCMDARLHPAEFLGLRVGDAHVIRNAGGRVSEDVIRSLVISERLLGTTEVVVIHHTDCGMASFTNEDLAAKVREDLGVDAGGWDFLPFTDLEQSVRDDVAAVRDSELIPDSVTVSGAIYDVESGELREVVSG